MYQGFDEQSLATLCSQHNRLAQEELYKRYATRIFTLCRRYTSDKDEAQDLLHDVFLKVLENSESFCYLGEGSLLAWISQIAIHVALSHVSRYKHRFVLTSQFLSETASEPTEEELYNIPIEQLLEFVSNLHSAQRIVFNLFCMDGYSHKEIAEMLGITEKGSASTLAKAKDQLCKQIDKYINKADRQ